MKMKILSGVFVLLAVFLSHQAEAFDAAQVFNTQCIVCHNITGGDKIGPELAGVSKRRSEDWILKFVKSPQAMIASGDKTANELLAKYKIPMADQNLADDDIKALVSYIEEQAQKSSSVAAAGSLNESEKNGGKIFTQNCSACHNIDGKALVGPALKGVSTRRSMEWILKFVKDPAAVVQSGDATANELLKLHNNILMPAQNLTDDEIKSVIAFVESGKAYVTTPEDVVAKGYVPQQLAANPKPIKIPFLNDNQGYAPDQPLPFSHKIHAGDNQIACQYCHFGAEKSRHAGIPSVDTCLNCHNVVRRDSPEIAKIHKAKADGKSIEWVRIHKLPDFVYFSHQRHVAGGKIDCQTCHGEVQNMERLQQESTLNMGWCVNCHRDTEIDVHSPYFGNLKNKKAGMTEADVGGLDCAKCHY